MANIRPNAPQNHRDIYNVSRLTAELSQLVKQGLPAIWLEGEVSNFAAPRSGHWYFTLKDQQSQIRCAMFANRNRLLRFTPRNGEQVLVRAKAGVFEPRGELQLIAEQIQPAGEGALTAQYEALKAKLQAEGLFAETAKKTLPSFPRRLGVITSPTGAAVQDVLNVLRRRYPALEVIIYPTLVQGDVGNDIAGLLSMVQARNEVDLILLTRGGGSLEDLWAFNNEQLARTIHACELPVVSAIGHEVDFTIADFVADVRAPTPSAAAELISPDGVSIQRHIGQYQQRMTDAILLQTKQRQQRNEQLRRLLAGMPDAWLAKHMQRTDVLEARLSTLANRQIATTERQVHELRARLYAQDPRHAVHQAMQTQCAITQRLGDVMQQQVKQRELKLNALQQRLWRKTPQVQLTKALSSNQALTKRLHHALGQTLNQYQHRLVSLGRQLDTVSPLAVLHRGYTITKHKEGAVVKHVADVTIDDELSIVLPDGELDVVVTKTHLQLQAQD